MKNVDGDDPTHEGRQSRRSGSTILQMHAKVRVPAGDDFAAQNSADTIQVNPFLGKTGALEASV